MDISRELGIPEQTAHDQIKAAETYAALPDAIIRPSALPFAPFIVRGDELGRGGDLFTFAGGLQRADYLQ